MTFDRRRSELEARSLRRLDLPRVYHENQIAELDAHNFLKQEIKAKAQEIPLERKYKICADSLSLLRWILELHPEEFLSRLTPPIDDVIETEIGFSPEWEDDNLRAYIEVLIDEINEQTDFHLRAVDWHKYGKTVTRILVKKKEDDMQAITRSIQMLGLKKNRQVHGTKITAAINDLLA